MSSFCTYFPASDHKIANMVLPFVRGGEICGDGDGQYIKLGGKLRGSMSVVMPEDPTRPLFTLSGDWWKVHDLTMYGGLTPAALGLLITKPMAGLGSGKHNLDRLTFQGFKTGLQFGESLDTKNCDSTDGEDLWFVQCDEAIAVRNTMGMTCQWENINANATGDVFAFYAGGKHAVDGVFVGDTDRDGSILHLIGTRDTLPNNKGDYPVRGIGSNNDAYTVEDANIDTSNAGHTSLVTLDEHFPSAPLVSLLGGHVAFDHYRREGRYQAELRNPYHLVLDRVEGLQRETFLLAHDERYPRGTIEVRGNLPFHPQLLQAPEGSNLVNWE